MYNPIIDSIKQKFSDVDLELDLAPDPSKGISFVFFKRNTRRVAVECRPGDCPKWGVSLSQDLGIGEDPDRLYDQWETAYDRVVDLLVNDQPTSSHESPNLRDNAPVLQQKIFHSRGTSALLDLLTNFRTSSKTEREKGTYFEELIVCYLRHEATYSDLYSDVWTYSDWAKQQGLDGRDTGIDLVAKTNGTGEYHAIQCKLYAEDYRLQKSDIDSFFTASGKKPFTHRIIVSTTNLWSEHAEDALRDQQPPVSKIDLHDLENSQIDWSRYRTNSKPTLKTKKQLRDHQKNARDAVKHGLAGADRGKLIMGPAALAKPSPL